MAAGYGRGVVVNVELPRLDAPGSWKERPALIINTEDFHLHCSIKGHDESPTANQNESITAFQVPFQWVKA